MVRSLPLADGGEHQPSQGDRSKHLHLPLLEERIEALAAELQQLVALAVAQLVAAHQGVRTLPTMRLTRSGSDRSGSRLPPGSGAGCGSPAAPTAPRKPAATASGVGRCGSCACVRRWSAAGAGRWRRGWRPWGHPGGVRSGLVRGVTGVAPVGGDAFAVMPLSQAPDQAGPPPHAEGARTAGW